MLHRHPWGREKSVHLRDAIYERLGREIKLTKSAFSDRNLSVRLYPSIATKDSH